MNSNLNASLNANAPIAAMGRALIAAIFFISGVGKLMAPHATMAYIGSLGLPAPALGMMGALVLELAGAMLLAIGYKTRWVALLLAVYAIVTALIFHHELANQDQMFHFLKNLAMAGGLFQVVAFGPGTFSLDNRRLLAQRAAA